METKSKESLRAEFYKETGEKWLNSDNEPDIDYVEWLENKVNKSVDNVEQILRKRIAELYQADKEFCELRWDMSKSQQERGIYREHSNMVTQARQELEGILKQLGLPRFIKE